MLLPQALQEWLPEDHPAYFISDIVDQPDLSEITARYGQERRGGPPYHPRMMVKALLYAYCVGAPSSRRIASRLHEDVAFRVPAANNTPDFRTVSDFRKDHLDALSGLFLQALLLCQREGPVKLGHVALDGAKVRANASQHKAMSYQRMKEKEAQLQGEVDELLRRAQEVDEEEDRRYGEDRRGDELPEELAFREGRLEKIREALAALEAEAQAQAEQAAADGKEHPGVPEDKAQRNFTDPESRIMPGPGGRDFLQAYNCQAVVDHDHQVIIASRATNQASDKRPAVADLQDLGVDPFIAPEQTRHGHRPPAAAGAQGTHPQSALSQGPDEAEAADRAGSKAIRAADGDGGAGVRSNQAESWLPTVPVARFGEGQRGMVAHLHRPQPAQALQVRQLRHQPRPARRPHAMSQRSGYASLTPIG